MKVFQDPHKNFMLVSNSIIDDLMPILPPAAFKIVILIYRRTRGWHKDVDQISFSQIMKGTGIKSSATIAKHLDNLHQMGVILRAKGDTTWDANSYALNPHYDTSTLKNEVGPTLKNEVGPTLKNEDTKDSFKIQKKHMPLRADDDFSDLLGSDEPQPIKPTNGKAKLTETELAQMQTFGILPDQNIDPAEYALQQEIITAGWDIYSDDVRQGIVYFTLAVRAVSPKFALPKDTSTRKLWHKEIAGHLKNYSLEQLKDLYKRAIIRMESEQLSYWQPGSLTRWALPEVSNEAATTQPEIDISKGFYV